MYCLDTNILVDVIRGDEALGDKIDNLHHTNNSL